MVKNIRNKALIMHEAEAKVQEILNKIIKSKLSCSNIAKLDLMSAPNSSLRTKLILLGVVFFSVALRYFYSVYSNAETCLYELPYNDYLFRTPESCNTCVEEVHRVSGLTPEEFELKYAYGNQPVIVTDATQGWRAFEEFSFEFFKNLHNTARVGTPFSDCTYLEFGTRKNKINFDLFVHNTTLADQRWYFGWNTCYEEELAILKEYYERPYFLPLHAEERDEVWVFIGTPGPAAWLHVDDVRFMSWQAQIQGSKTWELRPPAECGFSCKSLTFTVNPGEILVVNTNHWYHKTTVVPGDISITIGTEYD